MKSITAKLFIVVLIAITDRAGAQPATDPHVRWLTGGIILGPDLMRFNADGTVLYTHSAADFGLKKWAFPGGELLSLTYVPESYTLTAALSHDQQLVAFRSSHRPKLFLCRVRDGSVLWSQEAEPVIPIMDFSTDDRLLLSRGYPGPLAVRRVADGELLSTAAFADSSGNTNHFAWASFVNESDLLALANGETVRFDAESGHAVWRALDPELNGSWRADISPDRREFCVAAANALRRYSTATGEMIADVYAPDTNVTELAYAPDGTTLAVALKGRDIEVRGLADGSLRRALGGLPEAESQISFLEWSPDGRYLAGGGGLGVYVWSMTGDTNARPFVPLVTAHRTPAQFSSDGQWVVKGSRPDDVVLLNANDGTVADRWTLEPEADVERVSTSPVSNVVFVPTREGDLQVRSLSDGGLLSTVNLFTNTTSARLNLDLSADGQRLLAVDEYSSRESFAVFSTGDWRKLRSETNTDLIRGRITPDGSRVVTVHREETRVWNVDDRSSPLVIPASGDLEFGREPDEVWTINRDGWIDLWRFTDGARLGGARIAATNFTSVLSPDRRLILTSEGIREPLKVWRTDNGELIGRLGGSAAVGLIRFTPTPGNRGLVATRRDGSLLAFDFPFFIQDFEAGAGGLRLRVLGAPGPFQLESSALPNTGWAPLGEPFEDQASLSPPAGPAQFLRVRR